MAKVKILSVCGSGIVSSTMVAEKLTEALEDEGFQVDAVECNPGQVADMLARDSFTFVAATTPVSGDYPVPVFNTVGLLTGMGEEETIEEIVAYVKKEA